LLSIAYILRRTHSQPHGDINAGCDGQLGKQRIGHGDRLASVYVQSLPVPEPHCNTGIVDLCDAVAQPLDVGESRRDAFEHGIAGSSADAVAISGAHVDAA